MTLDDWKRDRHQHGGTRLLAMMSDATARERRVNASLDFSPSGDLAAYDAIAEARAIIHRSEPIPEGYSSAERMYRGPLAGATDDAKAAAAEALARFVAE